MWPLCWPEGNKDGRWEGRYTAGCDPETGKRIIETYIIPRDPTDDCIAPKVQKIEMKTLLPEQLKSCLDAANAR